MTNIFIAPLNYVCEGILSSRYLSIHLWSSIQLFDTTNGEKHNSNSTINTGTVSLWGTGEQINFREQGNKRKIILRNKAIYFRGTGADF